VSTLWTPSGEHHPEPLPDTSSSLGIPDDSASLSGELGMSPNPEELHALLEVRHQIRQVPAVDVIANHVVQLFELALIHLGMAFPPDDSGRRPPANLPQSQLAIDAMATLVEGMDTHLEPHREALREGLAQIRLLYVRCSEEAMTSDGTETG